MIDEKDINKMLLKDTKQKKESGMIYGTKGKVTDFHKIGSMPLEVYEEKTINELFQMNDMTHQELIEKILVMKEIIMILNDDIKYLKAILIKYGME